MGAERVELDDGEFVRPGDFDEHHAIVARRLSGHRVRTPRPVGANTRWRSATLGVMEFHDREWARKGATLSDKTARSEYGLTQDEIFAAIDAGTLQYRPAAMHGNPWLRLLRTEVEALAKTLHGEQYLRERQVRTELAQIDRELKQLRAQLAALEERRSVLLSELGEQ
jgi:hypothetical protein